MWWSRIYWNIRETLFPGENGFFTQRLSFALLRSEKNLFLKRENLSLSQTLFNVDINNDFDPGLTQFHRLTRQRIQVGRWCVLVKWVHYGWGEWWWWYIGGEGNVGDGVGGVGSRSANNHAGDGWGALQGNLYSRLYTFFACSIGKILISYYLSWQRIDLFYNLSAGKSLESQLLQLVILWFLLCLNGNKTKLHR